MASSTIKPAGGGDYISLQAWVTAKAASSGVEDAVCFAGTLGPITVVTWAASSSTVTVDPAAMHSGIDVGAVGLANMGLCIIDAGVNWTLRGLRCGRVVRIEPTGGYNMVVMLDQLLVASPTAADQQILQAVINDDGIGSPMNLQLTVQNSVFIAKTGVGANALIRFICNTSGMTGTVQNNLVINLNGITAIAQASVALGLTGSLGSGAAGEEAVINVEVNNSAIFGTTGNCFDTFPSTGDGLDTLETYNINYSASSDATADDTSGFGDLINQVAADWFNGPPLDVSLKSGSPGINVGDPASGVYHDIIGTTRPVGARWDIGAFESAFGASAGGGLFQRIIGWTGLI